MNAKRQTVWLVSMLSLMVVLSAYYLFTEDVNQLDLKTATGVEGKEIKVDTSEMAMPGTTAGTSDKAAAQQQATDAQAGTQQKSQDASKASSKDASSQTSATQDQKAVKTDAQVLQQMETQGKSGSDFFASEEMKRNDTLSKQFEQLMSIITDSKQNSEAVGKAYSDIQKLQDQQAKVSSLEESLSKDFPNAFVSKMDGSNWKVIVQSGKLEKSQAVSIIDRTIQELGIGAHQVTVQYMP